MSLSNPRFTFLDFDGTYAEQPELCARFPHRWVDLQGLRQTRLCCSDVAFRSLCHALTAATGTGVTLLGSGDYHYVALALIARLSRPFTLVLIDHHPDSAEGRLPFLVSCGSWIRHAFRRQPWLSRAVMIGPPPAALAALPAALRQRIAFVPDLQATRTADVLARIPTEDVYLSIDKDAFEVSFARTNWDQGDLTLDVLQPLLRALVRTRRVVGVDLCGEWRAHPLDLLNPDVHRLIRRNELANERLLDLLLEAG